LAEISFQPDKLNFLPYDSSMLDALYRLKRFKDYSPEDFENMVFCSNEMIGLQLHAMKKQGKFRTYPSKAKECLCVIKKSLKVIHKKVKAKLEFEEIQKEIENLAENYKHNIFLELL